MAKYRKKPVVVEAFKWTGGPDQTEDPLWIVEAIKKHEVWFAEGVMFINTLEGDMAAQPGDFIIKDIKGELYSRKPDIFAQTYELVE